MLTVARVILVFLAVAGIYYLSPAHAGQLFPPANVASCVNGTVLAWNAEKGEVECVPALTGISVAC